MVCDVRVARGDDLIRGRLNANGVLGMEYRFAVTIVTTAFENR